MLLNKLSKLTMDYEDDENEFDKTCFKLNHILLDNLNVVYNASNSAVIFWNKFQIFIYESFDFQSPDKILVPEFHVRVLFASNNYLVCLDYSENIHMISLKFKNTHKRFKSGFQPRAQNIIACVQHNHNRLFCLKYESQSYFIFLQWISAELVPIKSAKLVLNNEHWPLSRQTDHEIILVSHTIAERHLECIRKVLSIEPLRVRDYSLVLISFDRINVYGCLFSPNLLESEITLIKLYTCAAEICNIEIVELEELNIIVGLKIGTVIKLCIKNSSVKPEVIHLNTAIYKFLTLKKSFAYTDGVSLWKAEEVFSDSETKLIQYFIRNVKDFIQIGDQFLCTTYNKLVYVFAIDDEHTYVLPSKEDNYYSAKKLFNKSEYLCKLIEQISLANELVTQLTNESDYTKVLALSARQDIMSSVLSTDVIVYEEFEEAMKENPVILFPDEMHEYFIPESFLIIVKITTVINHHLFTDLFSHLSDNLRLHITLTSNFAEVKTTSIQLKELSKKLCILVPINKKEFLNPEEINVYVQIVAFLPGVLHREQAEISMLYHKDIELKSEQFIKTNSVITNKQVFLKEYEINIKELIVESAIKQYGTLIKFVDTSQETDNSLQVSFYLRLPNNYQDILRNQEYCNKHFSQKRAQYINQQLATEEFIAGKTHVRFMIGNQKVLIRIIKDHPEPCMLHVYSVNPKKAFNLRNFLYHILYENYDAYKPGNEFLSQSFYTTLEKIRTAIKDSVEDTVQIETFLPLMRQFEATVIGVLPL